MATKISTIKTIAELKEAFDRKGDQIGYLDIMKAVNISYEEYEKHFTWNDGHYTRNRIIGTDEYEILVICWEKGQTSPIHDYDSKEAWVHILHGQLKEEKYKLLDDGKTLEKVSAVTLGNNDFSYMSGHVSLHRYVNTYESRTVSLHVYVNPLLKWNEYDEENQVFRTHHVKFDN